VVTQREYDPERRSYEPLREEQLPPHQRQLRLWLNFSVPAYLMKWRAEGKSLEELAQIGRDTADLLAHEGGAHLVDAARDSEGVESLAALGRAIAAGSFQPGGFVFLGQHWETNGVEWEADRLQRGAVRATVARRGPRPSPR
jgi:hypothetical protein